MRIACCSSIVRHLSVTLNTIAPYRFNTVSSYNGPVQQLHLTLLGMFRLQTASGITINLATDKVRGLLAYLAVEADRPHRREALAALFWPDMPDQAARSNLRLSLHRLRQAIDEQVPGAAASLLLVNRHVVQLHTAHLTRDHHQFQQAVTACEKHAHLELNRCSDCLAQLEIAAALYQGEFLAGFSLDEGETFEDWLLMQREYWQQKALAAIHTLTDMLARRSEIQAALIYAQRQIALDPYYEPAYQQAMRLHGQHERRPQAVALYEQLRHLLADELGVDPSPETTHLWQQIKDGLLQPADPTAQKTELHHFPTLLTPFVGRQLLLTEIVTTLLNPACRLLTLLGPGGIGKTRLSLQVGQAMATSSRSYRHGIYFISLAHVTAEAMLVTTLAQRLGLRLEEQTDPWQQLLFYLRDKEMLLVGDNFEQIVGAAAIIADILLQAPQVQILLTSREPLNIQAEWRQRVGGLDVSDEHGEAVELFQRSARRMVPNFQLRSEDREAVLALSRLVDGLPLALEIAAAWVRVMDPAAILRETQKSLDFLASPLRDTPERHQSVRGVLAQTWQMLTPHLQRVLACLAWFPGDFTLEATLAILPDVTMLDMATLLDKSLLHGRPQGRMEMHELLRQFVLNQPQPQAVEWQHRYTQYYLEKVARQGEQLRGRDPQPAIHLIQTELAHVRQAWQWGITHQLPDLLDHAAASLSRFYHLVGLFQEAETSFLTALAAATTWPETPLIRQLCGRLQTGASHFLGQRGQYKAAIEQAQAARQLAEAAGLPHLLAQAISLEGEWQRHLGQFSLAEKIFAQALPLYDEASAQREVAYLLNELGLVYQNQSQYAAALSVFNRAWQLYEAVGDQTEISTTLGNIGDLYQLKAEFPLALHHLRQGLAIAEAIGYKQGIVRHTLGLGRVYGAQGESAAAYSAYQKALQMAQDLGYVRGIINSLIQLGSISTIQGQFQTAQRWFQQAQTQAERAGLRDLLAQTIAQQAVILARRGESQAAVTHYEQAIDLYRELNDQAELGRNLSNLGNIYMRLGNTEQARQLFADALIVTEKVGARQIMASVLISLGNAHKRMGQYDQALAYYQQALTLGQILGIPGFVANSTGSIGLLHFEQGNFVQARQAYEQAHQINQEIGNALTGSLWLLNVGQVEMAMGAFASALANTRLALQQFRALANERYISIGLLQEAQILFRLGERQSALLILQESLPIAERTQEKQVLFEGHLLLARLWAALGDIDKADDYLRSMLLLYPHLPEQAQIHYYLWQIAESRDSQALAIQLYEQLLHQTPNWQYRQHLANLLASL